MVNNRNRNNSNVEPPQEFEKKKKKKYADAVSKLQHFLKHIFYRSARPASCLNSKTPF